MILNRPGRGLVLIPLLLAPWSCNKAKFNAGATDKNKTIVEDGLSCNVTPSPIAVGQAATVSVVSSNGSKDNVFQRIVGGGKNEDSQLVHKDGKFVVNGKADNTFSPAAEGEYVVELRKTADGQVAGACKFVANKNTTPAVCGDKQTMTGAQVAFIVDNSYSHSETDCQNIDQMVWNREGRVVCGAPTNRERAVMSAFNIMEKMSASKQFEERATSSFAIASFPTRNDPVNGMALNQAWLPTKTEMRNVVADGMMFTRQPLGYTPYGAGLRAATQLFANQGALSAEKAKVAVFVTDGEPTDRNPIESEQVAQSLMASGVKVITVYVTSGQTRAQRRTAHVKFLADEERKRMAQTGQHWFDAAALPNFDAYVQALLGSGSDAALVEKMTSKRDPNCNDNGGPTCAREIIEVANTTELERVFNGIVTSSVKCE
jgi:hypothetical protein